MARAIAGAGLFIIAVIGGCLEVTPQSAVEPPNLEGPERWGWQRNGSFTIPSAHVGDVYRVEYDVENSGSTSELLTLRVRSWDGGFFDKFGKSFDPPAVIEEWRPGERQGKVWVLGQDGTVAATIYWHTPPDQEPAADSLPYAMANGQIVYGPYGLVQDVERFLLFLGLAGTTVIGDGFRSWPVYLTEYSTFAWSANGTGFVGALGREHNGGVYGGWDMPPFEHLVEYSFGDAPVPLAVVGRQGVYGGEVKPDDPGLVSRLTAWERGDGVAVRFQGPTGEKLVLPEGRLTPGPVLPVYGLTVSLGYENATNHLFNDSRWNDWIAAHPDAWMQYAHWDDIWVENSNDERKSKWRFSFQSTDGATLHTVVSLNESHKSSEPILPLFERPRKNEAQIEVESFDASNLGRSFLLNRSQVPHILPVSAAADLALAWAGPNQTLATVTVRISDTSGLYKWAPDWPREMWFGTGRTCLSFRDEGTEPHRFGVTNVVVELATGRIASLERNADLYNCQV